MLLLSVLLLGLADDYKAEKDDTDTDKEAPAVARSHEEAKEHVKGTLRHLVLTVEAEFSLVAIARQRIEQKDVVRHALEPKRDGAKVRLCAEEIGEEEVGVDHCETRRERGSTHIHLVLHAVESSL